MRKFKCIVERTDEYVIEIDENIINEDWMEEFKKYFYGIDCLEEHAEHLAQMRARFGDISFFEGYGPVLINGYKPFNKKNSEVQKGINIIVVNEDNEISVDVEEIKEERQ